MPKIDEKVLFDDSQGKIIVKKTFDDTAELERVKKIRENSDVNKFGSDYKFVGSIPMHLVTQWCKELGVDQTDHRAVQEVMKKKMHEPEFKALLAWNGKY